MGKLSPQQWIRTRICLSDVNALRGFFTRISKPPNCSSMQSYLSCLTRFVVQFGHLLRVSQIEAFLYQQAVANRGTLKFSIFIQTN